MRWHAVLHRESGDDVHVAYVTDGRASRAGGLGPDAMAAQRRHEAAAAAPLLGVAAAHWLGLREREWEEPHLVHRLRELLRERPPDVLYVPSQVDFHPEHTRVARCVAAALREDERVTVRVYQVQVPLTPLLVNLVTPIQAVASQLRDAMRCYTTQRGSVARCFRMKAYGASNTY